MKENKAKVTLSQFHADALRFAERMATDEEIRVLDRTPEFMDHIKSELKKGKLISIQILGRVAGGKSTLASHLVAEINGLLGRKMKIDFITSDQIAFAEFVNKFPEKNVCVQVDEWNPMSETGFNATVEQKYLENINKVQAQRFIHRVSCSPDILNDSSADIVLETLDIDKSIGVTYALIYYRYIHKGSWNVQLIGHIEMNVLNTLNSEWYKEYLYRKFKKMELLNKENIRDERDIHQAELKLAMIKKLETLAEMNLASEGLIQAYQEQMIRKMTMRTSIIADRNTVRSVSGVLNAIRQKVVLKNKMKNMSKLVKKLEQKHDRSVTDIREMDYTRGQLTLLNNAYNEVTEVVDSIKSDLIHVITVGKTITTKIDDVK